MIDTPPISFYKDPEENIIPIIKEITCYRLEYITGDGLFNTRSYDIQTTIGRQSLSEVKAFHEKYFPGPICTRLRNIDLHAKMKEKWLFAFNSIKILNQNISRNQLLALANNDFKIYEITSLGYQDHVQTIFDPKGKYSRRDITYDLIKSNIFK